MAECIGGAFLSASFQVLFERLTSEQVLDFINGKNPINGLIKKLKITLLSANILLDDAEEKQIRNPMVREWLDELKEATYDAQDLASDIESEASRSKLMEAGYGLGSLRSKALKLVSISFDKSLEKNLVAIIDRLEAILRQKDLLGLRDCVQSRPSIGFLPLGLVDESGVFGRSCDKEAIVQWLISDCVSGDDKISVIPIVGMGGIGKTTLARLVFDDDRVGKKFDLKAWVTVPNEFDVSGLTLKLLEAMNSRVLDTHDPYRLQVRLKESLWEKKFFLVLDDVWSESYSRWDALRTVFESGARGSKIILTTRSKTVASMVRSGGAPIHFLKTISDEDGWSLFAKHAFGCDGDRVSNPGLEAIGRKIIQKCRGLPLAVKSLGGLLRYQLDPGKWETVLKSEIWDLPEESNGILPALWLSYYYLPSHLKRCFGYCSIFPRDYEFEREELVLLWMAEDLLWAQRNKTAEEVGKEYFDDLVARSLLQHSSHKQLRFTIHDLLSDLASYVSGEFVARLGGDDLTAVDHRTRHLSYVAREIADVEKLKALSKAKRLRTFVVLGWSEDKGRQPFGFGVLTHEVLPGLKWLRALSLSHCPIAELPETIGNLKNLRYLNLSFSEIKEIDSVCTLYNLQTLLLSFCANLTQLPTNIGGLISLRHVDISGTPLREMPTQLSKLKNLQKLSGFVLGKNSGCRIRTLKELKELRGGLLVSGLENIVDVNDVMEANLKEKKYLTQLHLQWEGSEADDSRKEKEVLDNLRPHTSLKRLVIESYRGSVFPNWVGDHSFSNMVMVALHKCKYCCFLPPLGQLPLLAQLHIAMFDGVSRIGEEIYSTGDSLTRPFRSLKVLIFTLMSEWKEWSFIGHDNKSEVVFPLLEDLTLIDCPKLKVNLTEDKFPSLKSLSITGCHDLDSIEDLPSSLSSLGVSDCAKLVPNCLNWDMKRLKSLRQLKVMDYKEVLGSFPNEGVQLPSTLTHLWIINLPKLRSLNGKAFGSHKSLEELRIHGCSQLKCLPEEGLPSCLNYLSIYFCNSLSEKCKRQEGEDWTKISHVGRVCINGKSI